MLNKNYIYLGLGCVIVVVAFLIVNINSSTNNIVNSLPSVSPNLDASPESSPVPSLKPTPTIKFQEKKTYMQWAVALDKENRYFAIDEGCATIRPSNVTFKNDTLVMLDNSASNESYTLKIGDRDYILDAHNWYLVTLSTTAKLPADLGIYCKNIELGSVRLE